MVSRSKNSSSMQNYFKDWFDFSLFIGILYFILCINYVVFILESVGRLKKLEYLLSIT